MPVMAHTRAVSSTAASYRSRPAWSPNFFLQLGCRWIPKGRTFGALLPLCACALLSAPPCVALCACSPAPCFLRPAPVRSRCVAPARSLCIRIFVHACVIEGLRFTPIKYMARCHGPLQPHHSFSWVILWWLMLVHVLLTVIVQLNFITL